MSPSLAIITVVRNEADRFLPSMLPAWSAFSDRIVLLDDGSTDDTRALATGFPKVDYTFQDSTGLWGREGPSRRLLFELAIHSGCEWLIWLDADMIPAKDPRPLMRDPVGSIAFCLFDLWDENHYRDDGYWMGHHHPRVWAIKNPGPDFNSAWGNERGIHCGHLPGNLPLSRTIVPPLEYSLLHYAYSRPDLRECKYAQYQLAKEHLFPNELDHAESILDPSPRLKKLPILPTWPITFRS